MVEIEPLRQNLSALIAESQQLRQDVHAAEAARRRENMINLMLSLLGVIIIGIVLAVAYQGQRLSAQNNEIIDAVRSCTTPQGPCYQEGRTRANNNIRTLVRANAYSHLCARIPANDTDEEIIDCITERLQADAASPAPAPSSS